MNKVTLALALFGSAIKGSMEYVGYQQYNNPVYNDNGMEGNYGNQKSRLVDMYSRQSGYSGGSDHNLDSYGGIDYNVPDYKNAGYPGYPVYGSSNTNTNNYAPDHSSYSNYFPNNHESYGSVQHDGLSNLLNMNHNKNDVASYGSGSNYGKSNTDAAYNGAEFDVRTNGYDQAVGYKGNELWLGSNGANSGYVKGEAYEQGGYKGFDKAEQQAGLSYAEKQNVANNHNIDFEIDHASHFKNDYADENHAGNYKGSEFDVAYKATDVNGGYYNDEKQAVYKGSAYDGSDHSGTQNNGGQYDGNDYAKYGSTDVDGRYREYAYVDNDDEQVYSPEQDAYPKGGNLYDKYAGTAPEEAYEKEEMGDWYVRPNTYRKSGDFSKDTYNNAYGANFEGNDFYGKSNQNEAYIGAEEAITTKGAYDKGQYRDVAAQGHNKEANYQGDYQTNKKIHDVDYNVKHIEDVKSISFGTEIKKDQHLEQYNNADYTGAYEAEKNYGDYRDAEYANEFDKSDHLKNYNGESYANGVDVEASVEQNYGTHGNNNQYQDTYQYPEGGDYYNSQNYGYGGYGQ